MDISAYTHPTVHGTWAIVRVGEQWEIRLADESLGRYKTASMALDDLVGGHSHWPASGIDPSTVGLPEDLSDWTTAARR